MIQNTLNNHLTYWYNDDENQRWRKDPNDYTSMRVGGCSRAPFSAKIEWTRIARLLIDQYPDLTIFMSGGLDSEIALRCFLAAGIKPKLATIRFPNDKNAYDIAPMIDMVQQEWGLDVSVIDFDPEEFCLSGEYLAIAEKYQAYTFYQQILLKVAEDYSAPMITVDEVELEKLPAVNYDTGEVMWHWRFLKKEDQDGVWRRFADKTGIPALNNFYTYTPESMLAFLRLPTTAALIRDQIPFKLSWTSSKMKIYSEAGFKFRMRPKWHGMENYMHLWDFVKSNQPTSLLGCTPQSYTIPALELEENLAKGRISQCSIL
jgi:hypothetical protein